MNSDYPQVSPVERLSAGETKAVELLYGRRRTVGMAGIESGWHAGVREFQLRNICRVQSGRRTARLHRGERHSGTKKLKSHLVPGLESAANLDHFGAKWTKVIRAARIEAE